MYVRKIIRNSKGDPIRLNERERQVAQYWQRRVNALPALGFKVDISTLTAVVKRVVEQQFFTVPPADYVPIRVGENPFSVELLTYLSTNLAGDFEHGLLDTGGDSTRMASAEAGLAAIRIPIKNWAKKLGWNIFDIYTSQRTGNWDIVSEKEKSRVTNWQLGIQRVAFLGLPSAGLTGLLTLPTTGTSAVTYDGATITKPLSTMTASEYSAFLGVLIEKFRVGNSRTINPNRLVIPESDYNGLAIPTSDTYPLKTKLELLEQVLRQTTQDPGFQVKPLAYAMAANSGGILAVDRYALYRYDESNVRMDIPVDYTSTMQNTLDGFHFGNVGYGQFSGVNAYRPGSVMYFDLDE